MFLGTYSRRIRKDGAITIPSELTYRLRKDGYQGFSSTIMLEETDNGNKFFYLQLDPIKEETETQLWLPESVRGQINPYRETNLVFLGSNDHVRVCSPSNWDAWEKEYMPRFEELLEEISFQTKAA